MKKRNYLFLPLLAVSTALLLIPTVLRAQSQGVVVEEIVARVNNQIITLSDYQKASQDMQREVAQDCKNCPALQVQSEIKDREKNLLRDLIDQQLLIERAKDMDISVETDLIKQLDDVRKQNNLTSMEDLQKAVESQGLPWEDYKTQLRNGLLTKQVVQREVGGRMSIGSDQVKKYYEDHKQDFNRPEQVSLQEIFLSTEGKTPEQVTAIRTKADDIHARIAKGEDFDALVKRYSEGSTAQQGGDLGQFERGQLSKQLEDTVFPMEKGQSTDVIQTKTGFEILKIINHFDAGLQPLDKVEGEITNLIYRQKMEPAMRDYLAELREESYVTVKAGYTDSAGIAGATAIQEVAPTPDTSEKKKGKGKLGLPKASGA